MTECSASAGGVRVRIEGVRRVFPSGVVAIERIDLDIAAGQFVAILGPSGCGKSTLLRLVAGLDRVDEGEVRLHASDEVQHSERAPIAYVFQDAHLLLWRNVLENVMLPLEFGAMHANDREAVAREALDRVGLSDAMQRYPAELSGGMRMRVSLARALVTQPRLLLLDEPFAALDELTRQRMDDDLRKLWMDLGMTVLFVTHSITEAVYLAERVVVLSAGPARAVADQRIDLPTARNVRIRTEPGYGRQVQELSGLLGADSTADASHAPSQDS
jgi:NitT/TauT family transport system ATP-binding protein